MYSINGNIVTYHLRSDSTWQTYTDQAYVKPDGGIPSYDLSAGVQESLALADTAVQPDDMTAALADKQDVIADLDAIRSGAAAGATAYQKPSGGIPGSDLDNGVRSDLNKARSAVQPGDLALVASTGSYNDLTNKPTIPAAQVNSDWNANSGLAEILNKPSLAAVATSGSYNDLSNKPTIPAAPGTLDTTATTAQATSSSEALSGSVTLHKISKTGKYSDLSGKPTVPVITLNGSTAGNPAFYAPTSAGTAGQVLVSTGGAPTWQAAPSGGGDVTDVTLGGTSVVDGNGVAVLPAYPVVPTLATVATTGDYDDLLNKPTIPDLTDYTDAELQTAIDTAFANL